MNRFDPSGDYRERMQLQYPAKSINTRGETVITYVTIGSIWCKVTPTAGAEVFHAQQLRPEITHLVRTRARTDVTPEWRLLFQKNPLRAINVIKAYLDEEYRGVLIIEGKEIVLT